MGQSLFIEPIKRWLQRRRSKEAVVPESPAEEDQLADVRDIFTLRAPIESQTLRETTGQPTPAAAATPENQVGLDLAQNVVGPRVTQSGGGQVETTSSPEPQVRIVSWVSAEAPPGGDVPVVGVAAGQQAPGATKPSGALSTTPPGARQVLDSLLGSSLKDIFQKKVVTSPHVKALLQRHGTVDARELSDELRDFARSIGASKDRG